MNRMIFACGFVSLFPIASPATGQSSGQVAVSAYGQKDTAIGVGLMRPRRGGECFVVTPRHVIMPDTRDGDTIRVGYADRVVVSSGLREERGASRDTDRYSLDAVILRVNGEVGRSECPEWPDVRRVSRALRNAMRDTLVGYVQPWTAAGPAPQVRVELHRVLDTEFTVRPTDGAILPGMSGSLVYLRGRPVGMLVSRQADGTGRALRLDYMEANIGRYFISTPNPRAFGTFVPFVSQWRTRRRTLAVTWAAASAATYLVMRDFPGEQTVLRRDTLPNGTPYTFTDTIRAYPARKYRWGVVGLSALMSVVEGFRHADRYYIPRNQAETPSQQRPHFSAAPAVEVDPEGGVRLQFGIVRF